MKNAEHVFVGGVKVATLGRAELCQTIVADCLDRREGAPRRPRLLFDSNGHGISLAANDPAFRDAVEQADVVHADGGFVVLASRYLSGAPVADRSATTDLIHDLVIAGLPHGLSHYLLGGTEHVNAECERRLRVLYPAIRIVGRSHGFFGDADDVIVEAINAAAPDILWIGLGKPREQIFAVRHKRDLRAAWAITCGGCFNYITGAYPRAPQWMQDHHLEWLFRATTSPALLWRYLTTSPHAIWLAFSKRDRTRIAVQLDSRPTKRRKAH